MARPGHVYPQVEPGALSLATGGVVACAPGTPVTRALARARAAGASVVVAGPRQAVRTAELARAADWGLGARPVREVAWADVPVLAVTASESLARRHALAGASLVLLRRGARTVAAIDAEALALAPSGSSILGRLERAGDRTAEARLWLLRAAGKLGESLGAPVHAVGGLVRDLLLGCAGPDGHAPDVDLVVEGDGIALARRLGEEIGTPASAPRRSRAGTPPTAPCSGAWTSPPRAASGMRGRARCPTSCRRVFSMISGGATSRSTRWRWRSRPTGSAT
jgi:hypothetical protein